MDVFLSTSTFQSTSTMVSMTSQSSFHAAAVNPPRKAKRPLPQEFVQDSSDDTDPNNPDGPQDKDDEGSHLRGSAQSSPKRTGGKKGAPVSRAVREQTRRQNHSKIEKRRRTKINDAMSELKRMVPAGFGREHVVDNNDDPPNKKGEKEFKLEVLEKTVAYMKHLVQRVAQLEGTAGPGEGSAHGGPSGPSTTANTSPAFSYRQQSAISEAQPTPTSPLSPLCLVGAATAAGAGGGDHKPTSLPSISSWINTPIPFSSQQLPSPPVSNRIKPYESSNPPSFTLPSPGEAGGGEEDQEGDSSEHQAASALVRIRSSSLSFKSRHSARSSASVESHGRKASPSSPKILTPASMLGLEAYI